MYLSFKFVVFYYDKVRQERVSLIQRILFTFKQEELATGKRW
jgi:hypothetical protein